MSAREDDMASTTCVADLQNINMTSSVGADDTWDDLSKRDGSYPKWLVTDTERYPADTHAAGMKSLCCMVQGRTRWRGYLAFPVNMTRHKTERHPPGNGPSSIGHSADGLDGDWDSVWTKVIHHAESMAAATVRSIAICHFYLIYWDGGFHRDKINLRAPLNGFEWLHCTSKT